MYGLAEVVAILIEFKAMILISSFGIVDNVLIAIHLAITLAFVVSYSLSFRSNVPC